MNKRFRILYVARTAKGGSARILYDLARGLDKSRFEPVVLCYAKHHIVDELVQADIEVILLSDEMQGASISNSTSPVKRRDIAAWLEDHVGKTVGQIYVTLKGIYEFLRWELFKIWPIYRAIRDEKIDLVHVNTGLKLGKAGIIAAWLARVPCVSHVHMFHNLNHFDRLFAGMVSSYIYISRAIEESSVAQGIPLGKGVLIHNGVDVREFSLSPASDTVRSEFGLKPETILVGVIGRLVPWKGHEYFIEGVATVSRQFPDLKALIIGAVDTKPEDQEYFQRLHTLTKELGVENNLIFTGFRNDIARLMSALDVVVHSSSLPEPFGLVVIEAMAIGKPVVATAAGGVLDIIEDKANGLLIPCQDSKAMAQAISTLLANKDKAKQLGWRARQSVIDKFTVQKQRMTVQGLYDLLLGKSQNCGSQFEKVKLLIEPSSESKL